MKAPGRTSRRRAGFLQALAAGSGEDARKTAIWLQLFPGRGNQRPGRVSDASIDRESGETGDEHQFHRYAFEFQGHQIMDEKAMELQCHQVHDRASQGRLDREISRAAKTEKI